MAARKNIADDLRRQYGSSLTSNQVLDYLGVNYKTGKSFLLALDSFTVTDGGHKRYLAIDMAAEIDKRQERAMSPGI